MIGFFYLQDFCLRFIVREANYNNIIMSKNFESVPQRLMVEIIRRRQVPQVITRDLVPRALSKPSPLSLRGKRRKELWERGGWITKGAVCLFFFFNYYYYWIRF